MVSVLITSLTACVTTVEEGETFMLCECPQVRSLLEDLDLSGSGLIPLDANVTTERTYLAIWWTYDSSPDGSDYATLVHGRLRDLIGEPFRASYDFENERGTKYSVTGDGWDISVGATWMTLRLDALLEPYGIDGNNEFTDLVRGEDSDDLLLAQEEDAIEVLESVARELSELP